MILPVAVAAFVAAAILYFARRSRAQYLALPELPAVETLGELPDHVVIIPARNEATNISKVVRSFPGSLVVVVDDHSTDGTSSAAEAAGAAVIESDPLPKGWLGKPNACWTGAQRTESRWLLFVDADTWYEPGFLASLLSYAESEDLMAVSCFPRQVFGSFAERILMPYAFGLYFTGVRSYEVNDPLRREALANGQCLLVRRDAYDFMGGHRSVATSIIEDVALARRLKQHRMKARVLRAEDMANVRMYESFRALRNGFEKNSFLFLRANPATGILVIVASIVMTTWLPVLGWLIHEEIFDAAAFFAIVPVVAWRRWYGAWSRALSAPVAIYLFQWIALSGMTKSIFGFKTDWKGRRVG